MRFLLRLLISLLVLAATGFIAYRILVPASGTSSPDAGIHSAVPALFAATFADQEGTAQPLSQWRGKILVVNFWATWCPPCREEMPELSEFQQRFHSKNVAVLGIATDEVEKIRAFVRESPTHYPLLSGDFQAMALAESFGNAKGILPYTVLINAQGKIIRTYLGRLDMKILEQDIASIIEPR